MVDFDDLILLTVQLFETQPEVLQVYQQCFQWITVDEYQDVNVAQYRLLQLLKTPEVNLCVIGDPDQAIYGFRGADRSYFLQFQQDFPDAAGLTPESELSFRTQSIVQASRQVIVKSPESASLEVWTEVVGKTKLDIYQAPTYKAEAEYVVHEIEKMVGGTTLFFSGFRARGIACRGDVLLWRFCGVIPARSAKPALIRGISTLRHSVSDCRDKHRCTSTRICTRFWRVCGCFTILMLAFISRRSQTSAWRNSTAFSMSYAVPSIRTRLCS